MGIICGRVSPDSTCDEATALPAQVSGEPPLEDSVHSLPPPPSASCTTLPPRQPPAAHPSPGPRVPAGKLQEPGPDQQEVELLVFHWGCLTEAGLVSG